jgi:prepilin-type N-terminal cleavage/methylation domain-containing protein
MLRLWLFRQPLRMGLFEGYCYMKFTCKAYRIEKKTAAPAVCRLRGGFTLLEAMVVIVIIGILSSLAYSSLIDVVFTNRAKEAAQAMRTFAERSLADAKRKNIIVELTLDGDNMVATFKEDNISSSTRQPLNGFGNETPPACPDGATVFQNKKAVSKHAIGVSGITDPGCFIACGAKGYCGAIVKRNDNNYFQAWIKKGSKATEWSGV